MAWPDGRRWSRDPVAAWHAVVGELSSQREWRQRKAALERAGWTFDGKSVTRRRRNLKCRYDPLLAVTLVHITESTTM